MSYRFLKPAVITTVFALLLTYPSYSQTDPLRERIGSIIAEVDAECGIAILDLQTNDTLSFNENKHPGLSATPPDVQRRQDPFRGEQPLPLENHDGNFDRDEKDPRIVAP